MNCTCRHMLRGRSHALQMDGDFVTVTRHTGNIQVVTSQGLEMDLYLEHDFVDGITTVLWVCGDGVSSKVYSDGVVVESSHQVITDLSAQIQQLHKESDQ
ncbi:putative tail protein [Corynebacterium phage CL31]|nr:putative tail protein [Corynebacterium phage CL31]